MWNVEVHCSKRFSPVDGVISFVLTQAIYSRGVNGGGVLCFHVAGGTHFKTSKGCFTFVVRIQTCTTDILFHFPKKKKKITFGCKWHKSSSIIVIDA